MSQIPIYHLNGLRILNTRPIDQAQHLQKEIEAAGGISILLPALNIESIDGWWTHLPDLTQIDQAIFISSNAAHLFFNALKKNNIKWPKQIKIIAIGKATANALASHDQPVSAMPDIADSEHLVKLPVFQANKDKTCMIIKGEGGRDFIEKTLKQQGAKLIPLEIYRRVLPHYPKAELNALWRKDAVDIILFTSEQAMQNFFALFDKEAHGWIRQKPCLVISERLAKKAVQLGLKTIFVSEYQKIMITLQKIRTCLDSSDSETNIDSYRSE